MAKALGALVIGAGCAGIYYLYTQTQQQPEQVAYVPVSQPARTKPKMDYAPLLSWGLGQVTKHLQNNKQPHWGTTVNRNKTKPTTTAQTPIHNLPAAGAGTIASKTTSIGGIEGRLLKMIGENEAPRGYDQIWGGIKKKDYPPKPLTQMTVGEVLDWQDSIDSRYNSEASGHYQVMEDTLRGLVDQGKVSVHERYDARTQDRIAVMLMEGRGLNQYKSGQLSLEGFAQNLSKEWASLPAITVDKRGRRAKGQSYYDGDKLNKSHTSIQNVLNTILGGLG